MCACVCVYLFFLFAHLCAHIQWKPDGAQIVFQVMVQWCCNGLVMVLYSLTVYDTMLCAFDCGGMVSWGMKLGFCICEWVGKNSAS